MTPAINVNLKPCDCDGHIVSDGDDVHATDCASTPVLIPCPIPRSVEMKTARLGECDGRECYSQFMRLESVSHGPNCPARPIRVICSIGGETWVESEVEEVEFEHENAPEDHARCEHIAAERWALVKALVLWHADLSALMTGPSALELIAQRDAVFAALADMARVEESVLAAKIRLRTACPALFPGDGVAVPERESSAFLAAYVSHLISQVGAL